MKLPSILGIRGARDKPRNSYGGSAYSFFLWVMTLLSTQSVRNINHPLCGCAVFVIQKNHLSVIMRLFKPIYNERKGDFNGQ